MSTQFDWIELKFGAAEKRLFTWKFVQVRPVASGIYRRSSFVSVGRWKVKKKAAAGGDPFKFNFIKNFKTFRTHFPSFIHSPVEWTFTFLKINSKITWSTVKWMNRAVKVFLFFQIKFKFFFWRAMALLLPSNPTPPIQTLCASHPEIPNLGRTRFRWPPEKTNNETKDDR